MPAREREGAREMGRSGMKLGWSRAGSGLARLLFFLTKPFPVSFSVFKTENKNIAQLFIKKIANILFRELF